MKRCKYVILVILCPFFLISQNVEVEGGLIADSIDVSSGLIKNVANPVSAQDAATKAYVDSEIMKFSQIHAVVQPIQHLLNTGSSPQELINIGIPKEALIGKVYQTGYIFYIESDGTGLVVSGSVLSSSAQWGCSGTSIVGADSYSIGGGSQNTIDIEAGCGAVGTAADICANFSINTFNDWFLPSDGELFEIYLKVGQGATYPYYDLGIFPATTYWSSTEL